MRDRVLSIRPFLGARDFTVSRAFYRDLGFAETVIDPKLSVFRAGEELSFYLQDYYVRKWVDNTMVFLEVDDPEAWLADLRDRQLPDRYPGVRISEVRHADWGREFFLHDPCGVLWHFGTFTAPASAP